MVEFKTGYCYARAMHNSTFSRVCFLVLLQEDDLIMARFLHRHSISPYFNRSAFLLAFSWVGGLLVGVFAACSADEFLFPLMRTAVFSGVSIVSVLTAHLLPFLLSAFTVFFSGRALVCPIVFCKGFCFAFVSVGILASFGCAGWLFRLLLCFADLLTMPLLYRYWHRCLDGEGRLLSDFLVTGSVCLLFGSIEYRLILPFLADLINSIER